MTPDHRLGFGASERSPLTIFLPLLVVAVSATACTSAAGTDRGRSTGYRTAFPATDMSGELSSAFEAVKQTQVAVTYDVHFFSEETAPTGLDFEREDVTGRAVSTATATETRAATAVLVSRSRRNVMLIAAAHAVFRPDTIVEYFGPEPRSTDDPRRRIRSLSIKSSQTNWVIGLPGARSFEVLAWDEEEDVALIGFQYFQSEDMEQAQPFSVRAGDPSDLAPGSFVYILGYPGSFRMVSRGIATPVEGGSDSFVVDGNWNQGVSGGAILALRGDNEGLEWVGMARAAAAVREQRFVPSETAREQHDPALPYEGPIFLEEILRIQYGVTLSVSMTTIRQFIERNEARLSAQGYAIPRL